MSECLNVAILKIGTSKISVLPIILYSRLEQVDQTAKIFKIRIFKKNQKCRGWPNFKFLLYILIDRRFKILGEYRTNLNQLPKLPIYLRYLKKWNYFVKYAL